MQKTAVIHWQRMCWSISEGFYFTGFLICTILRKTVRLDRKAGMSVLFGASVRWSKIMLMICSLSGSEGPVRTNSSASCLGLSSRRTSSCNRESEARKFTISSQPMKKTLGVRSRSNLQAGTEGWASATLWRTAAWRTHPGSPSASPHCCWWRTPHLRSTAEGEDTLSTPPAEGRKREKWSAEEITSSQRFWSCTWTWQEAKDEILEHHVPLFHAHLLVMLNKGLQSNKTRTKRMQWISTERSIKYHSFIHSFRMTRKKHLSENLVR